MLLLVLVVAALSHMTEATVTSQQVNISDCPVNFYGKNYSTLYISVFQNNIYSCFLGFKNNVSSNLCVWHDWVGIDQIVVALVGEGFKNLTLKSPYTDQEVNGTSYCFNRIDFYNGTAIQFTHNPQTVNIHGVYIVGSRSKQNTTVHVEGPNGNQLSSAFVPPTGDNFVLLSGCTGPNDVFVDPNAKVCIGDSGMTCSPVTNALVEEECSWKCEHGSCVNASVTCSVFGSGLLDMNNVKATVDDRCGYTLLSKDQVTLEGVFKDRRRKDFPLLDYLVLSVGPTKIRLGPGAARVQVNGSVANISTLMLEGINVSRISSGVSLHYQQMFELVFDGFSAVLNLKETAGLTGLCANATDVSTAKSMSLSENGCDTKHQEAPDTSIDCDSAQRHCALLNGSLFSPCHAAVDATPYVELCAEARCKYPGTDGFDCAFHQAYAAACAMSNVTLPEWRPSAGCGSDVALCQDTYCSDHEFCGLHMTRETCLCRSLFASKYRANDTFGEPTECGRNSASLSLAACLLAEKGVHYHELRLNDANCTGRLDPESHMLNFDFGAENMCGAEVESENQQLVFKNKVVLQNHTSGLITRHDQFEVDFSCFYTQPQVKTVAFKIMDSSVVQTIVSGVWSYNLTMKAYLDLQRTRPIAPETELQLNQPIWVELSTEGLDQNLVSIVTQSCWATSQQQSNSTTRYDLVQKGCPNPRDASVKLHGNGGGTSNFFSFNMFHFTGDSSVVYLHCEVYLCKDTCEPVCGAGRRRRSVFEEPNPGLISMSWTG